MLSGLARATSVGRLMLTSSKFTDAPIIDLKSLAADRDRKRDHKLVASISFQETHLSRKFLTVLASTQCYRTCLWHRSSENGNIDARRILVDYSRTMEKAVSVENDFA